MAKISGEIHKWCAFNEDTFIDNDDCNELRALADRIDAEMTELPCDKDGAPIHVGDTVYLDDGRKAEVNRIAFTRDKTSIDLWMCDKGSFLFSAAQRDITHTAPDSWERIANELDAWVDRPASYKEHKEFHTFAERIRKLAKEGE